MGLSSMPSAVDAFLPLVLLANVVLPFAFLRDGVMWAVLQVMGGYNDAGEEALLDSGATSRVDGRERQLPAMDGVRMTRFELVRASATAECCCCVCLHGYETDEEVSEVVRCRHFFHRPCLDRWLLDHKHTTCPLCRTALYC